MNKCFAFLLLTLPVFFNSCNSSKPQRHDREREQEKTYSQEQDHLQADLFLYHTDSIHTQLYFSLNNNQLVYKKTDSTNTFEARLRVFYKILPYIDSKSFIDSTTLFVSDPSVGEPKAKKISGYINLNIHLAQTAYLEVYLGDENSKKHHVHYLKCDKKNPYTQQNYLFLGGSGQVYFSNKIEAGNTLTVNNVRVHYQKARVDFFLTDYSLPPPPFSEKTPTPYPSIPDSTFYTQSFDGHSFKLSVAKKGVYFIRLDSSQNGAGCTLLGVEQNFPKVLSHVQMIAATRYIMSREEYLKLINASDLQAAIDGFWMTLAGNEERARELIKRYYNRVQDANSFFTSHVEGWKTDMGMVYIIFGPPNKTYKTQEMETWVYGQEGSPQAVTFKFEKIPNPFSENNFKLLRNISFRDPWYIAVNNWRAGHVYLEAK